MSRSLDKHLDPNFGPKRILSLAGGGVRGLVTLGMLVHLERLWEEETGNGHETRLCDHYDLIAGTSTGSIIASALSLGWRVADIRRLYDELCPVLFKRTRRLGFLKPKFDAEPLIDMLDKHLGGLTMGSPELKTGLLICAKRMDTDSAWLLSNNPKSQFYDAKSGSTYLPNKDYPLAAVIRASAAAPTFLEPVTIQITDGSDGYDEDTGAFVDGAISGHNCPAFAAYQMAVLPPYGFSWKPGEQNLSVLSLGTGQFRTRLKTRDYLSSRTVNQAVDALKGMINESQRNTILVMQALSHPEEGWLINSEIGALENHLLTNEPQFRFRHLDVKIEHGDLREHLNMHTADGDAMDKIVERMRDMANGRVDNLTNCYRLGMSIGQQLSRDDLFL